MERQGIFSHIFSHFRRKRLTRRGSQHVSNQLGQSSSSVDLSSHSQCPNSIQQPNFQPARFVQPFTPRCYNGSLNLSMILLGRAAVPENFSEDCWLENHLNQFGDLRGERIEDLSTFDNRHRRTESGRVQFEGNSNFALGVNNRENVVREYRNDHPNISQAVVLPDEEDQFDDSSNSSQSDISEVLAFQNSSISDSSSSVSLHSTDLSEIYIEEILDFLDSSINNSCVEPPQPPPYSEICDSPPSYSEIFGTYPRSHVSDEPTSGQESSAMPDYSAFL